MMKTRMQKFVVWATTSKVGEFYIKNGFRKIKVLGKEIIVGCTVIYKYSKNAVFYCTGI